VRELFDRIRQQPEVLAFLVIVFLGMVGCLAGFFSLVRLIITGRSSRPTPIGQDRTTHLPDYYADAATTRRRANLRVIQREWKR
jgi:hypothetical protein